VTYRNAKVNQVKKLCSGKKIRPCVPSLYCLKLAISKIARRFQRCCVIITAQCTRFATNERSTVKNNIFGSRQPFILRSGCIGFNLAQVQLLSRHNPSASDRHATASNNPLPAIIRRSEPRPDCVRRLRGLNSIAHSRQTHRKKVKRISPIYRRGSLTAPVGGGKVGKVTTGTTMVQASLALMTKLVLTFLPKVAYVGSLLRQ